MVLRLSQYVSVPVSRIQKLHYCTKSNSERKLYSHTVFLPKTEFPLRLDKNVSDRDEHIYKVAGFEGFYDWQRSHLSEPEFVIHDGPPYANGRPHMGHAINKILKDTILRYQMLKGNKVHYVPGWDCHGLPIELKAVSGASIMDPITIRSKARTFAAKAMEEQKKVFQSWGVIGDWKNSYQTFSVDYVKMQLRQFFKLYKNDFIYRDIKPVFWSPSSKTALAEAELEYEENHKSPSLYARFKLKHLPNLLLPESTNLYVIIWTTTPWTLPANSAVCYNETMSYSLVKKSGDGDDMYLVGSELLESLSRMFNCNFEVVQEFFGHVLEGATYIHPINKETECSFLPASHVTSNKGTGFVHTAPAHGLEDFLVSIDFKIPRVNIVNENGCYNRQAGANLDGKFVLTEGNKEVIELLGCDLMHLSEITHSYPYDWRTKKPVIIRASQQWFIDTNAIKDRATEILETVEIFPKTYSEIYKKDIVNQIQKRPYWCISRQRKWGVPIPVFYDKGTSKIILNENTIHHHCNLLEKHGTDFWWNLSTGELLPEQIYPNKSVEQGQDIMDIWLDSGLSWSKVLEGSKVADMYLEGVDQFRGWFQSSLLTSVAIRDKAPYKTIYVHGFAVDEDGNKMSKSTGNVIDPVDVVSGKKGQKAYGVDTLRWWVACHANKDTLANVSTSVLQSSADEVQKIRSVLRFALGGLADYEKSQKDQENLQMIDKYMLHLLYKFQQQVNEFITTYQFHKVSQSTINLLSNPVSALYYTAIKDRLYCDHIDSPSRRAAQFTLLQIFEAVTQIIAPIVPHLAEEMYSYFPQKDSKTYFTRNITSLLHLTKDVAIEDIMNILLECKRDINKKYGANTLDVKMDVMFSKNIFKKLRVYGNKREVERQLKDIFQVSEIKMTEGQTSEKFVIQFSKSPRFSCPRCRRVQSDKEHDLCRRCDEIVVSLNGNKSSLLN